MYNKISFNLTLNRIIYRLGTDTLIKSGGFKYFYGAKISHQQIVKIKTCMDLMALKTKAKTNACKIFVLKAPLPVLIFPFAGFRIFSCFL
jgi:hypothetical protein